MASFSAAQPAAAVGAEPTAIPFRAKALFASGDMVDGVINFGVGIFVFYYLTAVCGIAPTNAGALLALSILCDAVLDPLIGSITDTARTRFGRRVPFMAVAVLPTTLAFGLLFSIPATLSGLALTAYVAAVLLLLRISSSFYILPYAAAGAELSTDYAERSTLMAHRTFFNCIGNIVLLVLGYWVFMRGAEGLLDRHAYAGFGWTCAAVALVGGLTSSATVFALRERLQAPPPLAGPRLRELASGFLEVSRNRSFWRLFLSALFFWTSAGLVATLGIHANLYFWRLPTDMISSLPLLLIFGFLVAIPFCSLTLLRFEKRDVSLMGFAVACGVQLLPVPLRLAGLLPDGPPTYILLGSLAFVSGAAGTFGFVPLGSMMADAADEHELLFDRRREGLYFAGLLLSVKAAAGLGGFLAGVGLDAIRFPRDVSTIATHPLPHATLVKLGLIQGPVAAAIGVLSGLALIGYRIDRPALARIQDELARRRVIRGEIAANVPGA